MSTLTDPQKPHINIQSLCDHIGIEPISHALRAIEKHNIEHVYLLLESGQRVYYHDRDALAVLDNAPETVLSGVGVAGIAWDGSDWEYADECPVDPEWAGLDRLRGDFHAALKDYEVISEVQRDTPSEI